MLRKEDPRFIRGLGHYCDDMQLPGMLHLAILRSPVAHARIVSVDTSAAEAHPKVKAVVTGADLAEKGLAWMPTLSNDVASRAGDRQGSLPGPRGRIRRRRGPLLGPRRPRAHRRRVRHPRARRRRPHGARPDAPVIRDDLEGKTDNHCFDWETGDAGRHERRVRSRPTSSSAGHRLSAGAPGADGDLRLRGRLDRVDGKLTLWTTSQAPHAHRTVYALVAGLPEHKIRVISPDIGGGFGNKVPIYPGYVCAIVGSLVLGKPVKWMEDRSENLICTGFARDYIMRGEIAATKDGKILAIRTNVLADHGAFNGTAAPVKYPAGFFGVFTGSYDLEAAYCNMTAVYTNKAPGGVAYACSFRITEAVYLVERIVDCLAFELNMDPAELRLRNFIRPEQFPYKTKTGWVYDSGDYERAMRLAMEMAGYDAARAAEQAEKRARGELMGIGVAFFTEAVGAGPRKDMDILGPRAWPTAASCASTRRVKPWFGYRSRPRGRATRRPSPRSSPKRSASRPRTSRSCTATPTTPPSASAPTAAAPRRCPARPRPWWRARSATRPRSSPRGCSRCSVADLEWEKGSFHVKGDPSKSVDHPGHRHAGARRRRPPRGHRGRPRGPDLLQPREPHLPLRRLHLRGRRRPRARPRSRCAGSSPSTTAAPASTR